MEENQQTQAAQSAPCEQTTQPVQPAQPVEFAPDSNLVWAILCTVLCCLPLGVVAIVKSASVDKLWMQGRKEEAKMAAKAAKSYSIWGAVISLIILVLYFIVLLAIPALGLIASSAH
jgi:uncharacterized membrane protein